MSQLEIRLKLSRNLGYLRVELGLCYFMVVSGFYHVKGSVEYQLCVKMVQSCIRAQAKDKENKTKLKYKIG